jgi:hypothetical protein
MIVAAHQPNFLPWLGFFHKIASCDLFVILDHVQYEQQNFQNRNRFKLTNGANWLTVPVEHNGPFELIDQKRIRYHQREDWRQRCWNVLAASYRAAPHFATYAPPIREIWAERFTHVLPLNLALLQYCCDVLQIRTPMVMSSSLGLNTKKSEMVADLVERAGGSVYLSGAGGSRRYLDLSLFAARGLTVRWQEYRHPVYPQLFPEQGFVPSLSVLDLLFNCGPASRDILMSGGVEERRAVGVAG